MGGSVYRPLDAGVLEQGEVRLGDQESRLLGLPLHSSKDIELLNERNEVIRAGWDARERVLSGESLHDYLELEGRVGWSLRFERRDDQITIAVVEHQRFTYFQPQSPGTPKAKQSEAAPKAKKRKARAQSNRFRMRPESEFDWSGPKTGRIGIHRPTLDRFREQVKAQGWDEAKMVATRLRGERLAAVNSYDELLALDFAHIDYMPHQEATAIRVLNRPMQGRAVLADEVGLGKTIEAGLILKELSLRGMGKRILIICPAGLRNQWKEEMASKFEEAFTPIESSYASFAGDRLIMSLEMARSQREQLIKQTWDLVIFDEAHRLAGSGAVKTRELVKGLKTQNMLFLTATPVQNSLSELYRLVEMLRPGTFATEKQFKREFVDPDNERHPVKPDELRRLVRQVMVRTTRAQAGIDNVTRHALDLPIILSSDELSLYRRCLDAIRGPLAGTTNHFQRNYLAKRLTVSPRSLTPVALRMAAKAADPSSRAALEQIAHECGDFGMGTRETVGVEQALRWVKEHGRVLIFTQHTDVLDSLMRAFDESGTEAIAYHGGMSSIARGNAKDHFTRAKNFAPILISTDAGAEGLNLQAANCVMNFDLPWNPMRIEQRIGRVHRVTQKRDVHVRNLLAVNTIDENVYWLLKDKLAMFELLFGQVTTILGELDVGKEGRSFEQSILDAVSAPSDREAEKKFQHYGDKLAEARSRADEQMQAGSHIDRWADASKSDAKRRAGMPAGGATELRPELRKKQRKRQKEVGNYAREVFDCIGAAITRDKANVISVRIPEDWVDDFDERVEMHLALSPDALDLHPDAELFAVGTEAFDEVLGALRLRGDLLGSIIEPPDISQVPMIDHVPEIEMSRRWVTGPHNFGTVSTWRVTDPDTGDEVLEVESPEMPSHDGKAVKELSENSLLPDSIKGRAVVDSCVRAAKIKLAELSEGRRYEAETAISAEVVREIAALDKQIKQREVELSKTQSWHPRRGELKEDIKQFQLVRARQEKRSSAAAELELRGELLAIDVRGGDEFSVHEEWVVEDGSSVEIEYPWDWDSPDGIYLSEAGAPVTRLAFCASTHVLDASEIILCEDCLGVTCGACLDEVKNAPCLLCSMEVCGACREAQGGLCSNCADPQRADHLDRAGMVAWSVGADRTLLVAAGYAELVSAENVRVLVPSGTMSLDSGRVRALAVSLGAPLDAGIQLLTGEKSVRSALDLIWDESFEVEWNIESEILSVPAEKAIHLIDNALAAPLVEADVFIEGLLNSLRTEVPPAAPPVIVGRVVQEVRRVTLSVDGLLSETTRRSADSLKTLESTTSAFENYGEGSLKSVAVGCEVEVRGINHSAELIVTSGLSADISFVPGTEGVSMQGELDWAKATEEAGFTARHRVDVGYSVRDLNQSDFAAPVSAKCLERGEISTWGLVPGPGIRSSVDDDLLRFYEGTNRSESRGDSVGDVKLASREVSGVVHDLLDVLNLDRLHVEERREVIEKWQGVGGVVAVRYPVPSSGRVVPLLSDGGIGIEDFTTDSHGHLARTENVQDCGVCGKFGCNSCTGSAVVSPCPSCEKPTCNGCMSKDMSTLVEEFCERCSDRSCKQCGRGLRVSTCGLCSRTICSSCQVGEMCQTCSQLSSARQASDAERASLPAALAARGLQIRVSSDEQATILLLAGAERREVAVIINGEIVLWEAFDGMSNALRTLKVGVAQRFDAFGDATVRSLDRSLSLALPRSALSLLDEQRLEFRWEIQDVVARHVAGSKNAPQVDSSAVDENLVEQLVKVLGLEGVSVASRANVAGFGVDRSPNSGIQKLIDSLANGRSVATGEILIEQFCELHQIWLTGSALRERVAGNDGVVNQDDGWHEGPADWATNSWKPEPIVVEVAEVSGASTALMKVGGAVVLGVSLNDSTHTEPTYFGISGEAGEFEGILLGELIGDGQPLDVTEVADPARLVGPKMAGGEFLERVAVPVLEDSRRESSLSAAMLALDLWADGARPVQPTLLPFPDPLLASRLHQRVLSSLNISALDVDRTARRVSIPVHVIEQWSIDGNPCTLDYILEPGETKGLITAHDTHERIDLAVMDSFGHLVSAYTKCEYCEENLCGRCERSIGDCSVCSRKVCDGCAGEPNSLGRRCGACASVAVISAKQASKNGFPGPKRGDFLSARDALHIALFTRPSKLFGSAEWTSWEQGADGTWRASEVQEVSALHEVLNKIAREKR